MEWEKTKKIFTLIENSIKTTIDERGRLYIPKRVRKKLLITSNKQLFIIVKDGFFIVYTSNGLIKNLRVYMSEYIR